MGRGCQVVTHYLDVVSRSSSQLMPTPSTRGLYESARCMAESILEGFIEWGMREEWDVPSDHLGNRSAISRNQTTRDDYYLTNDVNVNE